MDSLGGKCPLPFPPHEQMLSGVVGTLQYSIQFFHKTEHEKSMPVFLVSP